MTKTKAILHAHARRRAVERYGFILNKTLRREAISQIQNRKAKFIRRQSLTRAIWQVILKDQKVIVVYDNKRKAIVTCLIDNEKEKEPI